MNIEKIVGQKIWDRAMKINNLQQKEKEKVYRAGEILYQTDLGRTILWKNQEHLLLKWKRGSSVYDVLWPVRETRIKTHFLTAEKDGIEHYAVLEIRKAQDGLIYLTEILN